MKLPQFLIITLFSLSFVLAEEKSNLPDKAERVIQSTKAAVYKDYKAEILKLLKELEKIKTEETKAGRLETALAVDSRIKEVSENDFILADIIRVNKEVRKVDLLGKGMDNSESEVIGTWNMKINGRDSGAIEIKKDKTVANNWNENWTWSIENKLLTINTDRSGMKNIVIKSGDISKDSMSGVSGINQNITFSR